MPTDTGSPVFRVLGVLPEPPRKCGNGYEAKCPAHEDRHASLSIGVGLDGRVLLNCHAGCSTEKILNSIGLGWDDLFEHSANGNLVRRFQLINSNGKIVATHVREELPGDKKLHWESNGKRSLGGIKLENLPLYRLPDLLAADPQATVVVCEGEKAADALAALGVLAVGTVTGANVTPSDEVLKPLCGHEVLVWPDNDDPGRSHMLHIAARIQPLPQWIIWEEAPDGGDAADYVAAGGTVEGIIGMVRATPAPTPVSRSIKIWKGDELARARFDPVRWAIPEVLPAGLTILAGRPKLGKSWLVLGWALDVPRGGPIMRRIRTEAGDTLYLALEDNDRRMQERQALMLGDIAPSPRYNMATAWPRMDEGGLDEIERWIESVPNPRLVIIDTFKRFRPKETKMARLYDLDYDAIAPVQALALKHNVAIVVVLHTNKTDPSDPIDLVSGTLGLSGASDGVLVLKRERGQADASLFVTGRDVEEQDLALKWDKEDLLGWALLGQADDFRRSKERQELLAAVSAVPGMTPAEIANATQRKPGNVRYLLFRMTQDGEIRNRDGKYFVLSTTANTANTAKTDNPLPNANGQTPSLTPVSGISSNSRIRPVSGVSGHANGTSKPVCRACGGELQEGLERIGLHYDCTLEFGQ